MSISTNNTTFLLAILISFISFSYTASTQCLYELKRTQNVVFSLQNAIDSEDIYDLYNGMSSLMTSATQINKACSDIHLEIAFEKINTKNGGDCGQILKEITSIVEEFDSGKTDIKSVQKLLNVFPTYKSTCFIDLEEPTITRDSPTGQGLKGIGSQVFANSAEYVFEDVKETTGEAYQGFSCSLRNIFKKFGQLFEKEEQSFLSN